uniref:Uncharacterized protein n=1 Tax=Papio anubis TaxID=9555 RepID=A0A8I5N6M0_PAPAN
MFKLHNCSRDKEDYKTMSYVYFCKKKFKTGRAWWFTPVIPAFWDYRCESLCLAKLYNFHVHKSTFQFSTPHLKRQFGDQDTMTGFLPGGIGELNENYHPNFLVVKKHTTISEIKDTFRQFLNRTTLASSSSTSTLQRW